MATTLRPTSSSSAGKNIKGNKADGTKSDMWSSLLDSVASGKRLPEKQIVLLGGSSTTQKDFMDMLGSKSSKVIQNRQRRHPAVANDFALGYTYQEVLDTDQEDIIARLSIYTLQDSAVGFSSLVQPLLTPSTISETLVVILLDWSEPWNWMSQLQSWINLIQTTVSGSGDEAKKTSQEIMNDWEQQRRGGAYDMGLSNAPQEANVTIPLGPGEWNEPLGLPLCVVCHNADQIDVLEREHGWREDDFDYVLQFLRTVLLKHGASLVYTSNSMPNSAPLLIQYSLGIRSVLKREPLKHNVIDKDKILIPPNWDSWGKIKVLREGFDIEGVSEKWSLEIQGPSKSTPDTGENGESNDPTGLMQTWQESVKNPTTMTNVMASELKPNGIETQTVAMQDFLAKQTETIERLKAEEDEAVAKGVGRASSTEISSDATTIDETSRVKEHVGPIQFNMGGINLDAEDMLNHIKERGNARSRSPEKIQESVSQAATPEPKPKDPEALANFFASLIKKSGGSASGTPPRASRGT